MNIRETTTDNIFVALTDRVINVGDIVESCTHPRGGSVMTFVGTTRDFFEDSDGKREVITLSYEADEELALNSLKEISEEAIQKFGCLRIIIIHRLGEVPVGGVSIVVAVSTEHRKEGFAACEYIMKDLKKKVAIWKKEIYSSGESTWKENSENFDFDHYVVSKLNNY